MVLMKLNPLLAGYTAGKAEVGFAEKRKRRKKKPKGGYQNYFSLGFPSSVFPFGVLCVSGW